MRFISFTVSFFIRSLKNRLYEKQTCTTENTNLVKIYKAQFQLLVREGLYLNNMIQYEYE